MLAELLRERRTLTGTCASLRPPPVLSERKHGFLLIDEAGQATEPQCIDVLPAVEEESGRFVLCGDHNQLPATVKSQVAKNGGMETSLLERLVNDPVFDEAYIMLNEQYRMVPEICVSPSAFFLQRWFTHSS